VSMTTLSGRTGLMLVDRNMNIESEQGLSLLTDFTLTPSVPVVDLSRLHDNVDPQWLSWT